MNSALIFPGDIPLMTTIYTYRSQKVLVFIAMEGSGSTKPDVNYLSHYPDNYSNVSIYSVFCPYVIGRYLSAFNVIENQKIMRHSNLALDEHWVT